MINDYFTFYQQWWWRRFPFWGFVTSFFVLAVFLIYPYFLVCYFIYLWYLMYFGTWIKGTLMQIWKSCNIFVFISSTTQMLHYNTFYFLRYEHFMWNVYLLWLFFCCKIKLKKKFFFWENMFFTKYTLFAENCFYTAKRFYIEKTFFIEKKIFLQRKIYMKM